MPAVKMPLHGRSTGSPSPNPSTKPLILHLGDPIEYNTQLYDQLKAQFGVINPSASDRERPAFLNHLKNKTWGDFAAIMRPFWNTGGEMGRWDRELIELLPREVKVYASAGAGYDWVDTDVLAEHGIIYCNSRGASTEAVADMALYHIIGVFRCMTRSHLAARSLSDSQFNDAHYNLPVRSHNPRGHTIGIIGLGDIGFAIAQKVKAAFGMKVLYNDVVQKSKLQEKEVSATFYPNLKEMLQVSDCVLIATPSTGKQLITASLLQHFKQGSRLVNIARGSLVDEDALADALDDGRLTAVGMDVHANEPRCNARLVKNLDVTPTCHTGGGALETIVAFESLAMENVDAVLKGKEALTAVNAHLIKQKKDVEGAVNGVHGHDANKMTNGHKTDGAHTDDDKRKGQNTHGKMANGCATNKRQGDNKQRNGTR